MPTRKKPAHYLGQPAFYVRTDGRIVRTAVSELGDLDGSTRLFTKKKHDPAEDRKRIARYRFLYGGESNSHFFNLDKAFDASEKALKARTASKDITKTEEEAASAYLRRLRTKSLRDEILAQPLVEDAKLSGFIKARELKADEVFPTEYFVPGQTVYGLITPKAHYGTTSGWRPYPYFILRTMIHKVSYAPRWQGRVYYSIGSHYTLPHNRLCATEKEARKRLVEIFKETGGTIKPANLKCISIQEEYRVNQKMMKNLLKSHHL